MVLERRQQTERAYRCRPYQGSTQRDAKNFSRVRRGFHGYHMRSGDQRTSANRRSCSGSKACGVVLSGASDQQARQHSEFTSKLRTACFINEFNDKIIPLNGMKCLKILSLGRNQQKNYYWMMLQTRSRSCG